MAKTLSENAHLPAGYDDKGSRWFVPEEARRYYGPVDKDVERKVFDTSARLQPNGEQPDRYAYAQHVLRENGDTAKFEQDLKAAGDDPRYRGPVFDAYNRLVNRTMNSMTLDDELWWIHHTLRLPAALSAHRYAIGAAHAAERLQRQQTCAVCGLHDAAEVSSYQIDAIPVVKDNTLRNPFLCRPCAALVPVVRADTLVNGRSRRELVAEWVARGTR